MNRGLHNDLFLILRLLRQTKPQRLNIVFIYILELLAAPLSLMIPVPLMVAVNCIIGDKPLPTVLSWVIPESMSSDISAMLILVAVMIFGIALVIQLQHMSVRLLQTYVGEKLTLDFRARLMSHSQKLSLAYHDRKGTTDAVYRVQYDAPAIQWVVVYGLAPFGSAALTIIGMIAITVGIDFELAMVALTIIPLLIALIFFFRHRLRNQWLVFKELETSALAIVQEALSALRVVKVFGQEDRENDRFTAVSRKGIGAQFRVVILETAFGLLVALTIAVGTAAVLYLGVLHVLDGELTLGALLLVMSYLSQLYHPLETIGKQLTKLQGCLASAQRAFVLLDQLPEVGEKVGAKTLKRANGYICFTNVRFGYDADRPVLDNISLEIPPGSRVGILGKTGAGKSTLVNLLMRLYDPQSGIILLDGVDISYYKLADLRRQFAMVLQEPLLLSSSIAENIAYGRPNADINDIVAAARAANVDEFVQHFPDGYQTQVGERGLSLSGGQRQRIAIARAFLKDAPILILDEPTSSVDTNTEKIIIKAMDRLMKNRTTLMIAHRTNTLKSCNMLLEMINGQCRVLDVSVLDTVSSQSPLK